MTPPTEHLTGRAEHRDESGSKSGEMRVNTPYVNVWTHLQRGHGVSVRLQIQTEGSEAEPGWAPIGPAFFLADEGEYAEWQVAVRPGAIVRLRFVGGAGAIDFWASGVAEAHFQVAVKRGLIAYRTN